jgi:hypothetical protein
MKIKIIKVEPGARENDDNIVEAYFLAEINNQKLELLIANLYKLGKPITRKKLFSLEGKQIELDLSNDIYSEYTKLLSKPEKNIVQPKNKAGFTCVKGQVIENAGSHWAIIDCGFNIKVPISKKIKVGQFIECIGQLRGNIL